MPTSVSTARQCLTEEAARALDEAVTVAKRRNHSQTTSLHAVSSLLTPSFSLLRDSLTRVRSSAYSPRLQFRALELCVGVSLDRLPSKPSPSPSNDDFAPPISNSLMAAIKRSQANQRRQPDLYTANTLSNSLNNNNAITSVKVELKHFVISILDDPIVSRVFGEAGFRSSDIKFSIIHPPAPTRWAPARCPPLFLCNILDFDSDDNCRRIMEVMVKRSERNPLLVGARANDALAKFKDGLAHGRFAGVFSGVKIVSLEREIERRDQQGLELKIEEVVKELIELVVVVVVHLGELKGLVCGDDDEKDDGFVKGLVVKLSGLMNGKRKEKVWLIGAVSNYETYSSFVGRFPNVEKDWDLHPLPITSSSNSSSSFDGFGSKSSLMGSFVPFGGFFPTPSDFRPPLTAVKPPFTRCHSCNEKYEQEVSAVLLREGSSSSGGDQCSASLPPWLQRTDSDLSKGGGVVSQVKDVKTLSNERVSVLQKKWDDHCLNLHQRLAFPAPIVSLARPQMPHIPGFQLVSDKQGSNCSSNSGDSSLNDGVCSNTSSGIQIVAPNMPPQQKVMTADFPRRVSGLSECRPTLAYPVRTLSPPQSHKAPTISVTTDLGLGTIYGCKAHELARPQVADHQVHLHLPSSISSNKGSISVRKPEPNVQSSFHALDPVDYKPLFRKLSEAVPWQGEAISIISQTVAWCRSGNGPQRSANTRGSIWLSFLGPDKIGKRRVAEALADAVFGSKDRLIAVDLSSRGGSSKANSLFLNQGSQDFDINMSRMTVVDHMAQEFRKKPHSVVFLEDIGQADPLVQSSLSRAIQTGKFQDSRGREVSLNNAVFVATSRVTKNEQSLSPRKEFIKFGEEKILEAKNWQMQIAVSSVSGDCDASTSNETRVLLVSAKCALDQGTPTKRKLSDISDPLEHSEFSKPNKTPKKSLDLNLPLEEVEGAIEIDDGSRVWLEDLFGQVDGNVDFKPFDFDALADKLLRKIRLKFEEISQGERMSLEIEQEVMIQILAAVWCSDNKGAIEDWIEQVLGTTFNEARERYPLKSDSIVRLGSCPGVPVKELARGICLPRSIDLSI